MRKLLEEFEGFTDRIDVEEDVVYVTIKSKLNGDVLWAELTQAEVAASGVRERRRFKLFVYEYEDGTVGHVLEDIPDLPISDERSKEIDEMLLRVFGDLDLPQSDY